MQAFENQDAKKIEKLVDFPESTEGHRQNPKKNLDGVTMKPS